MPKNLFGRYIWLIDSLARNKRLTKAEINELWPTSSLYDGKPIPERTFYHYRRAIEDNLNIKISCDSSGGYYLDYGTAKKNNNLTQWMLDSMAVSSVLVDNNVPVDRIELEDVPSAREFLPTIMDAMKRSRRVMFTYAGYARSRAEAKIVFSPYFLRRYKQRWYVIGLKAKDKKIRTYALDRIQELKILDESFEMPPEMKMDSMFAHILGVTTSEAPVRTVRLQADYTQAKYLRALPLHHTQSEEIGNGYSIFTYRLKLNYELVHEILAMGASVKVLEPAELKAMVINELKDTLQLY